MKAVNEIFNGRLLLGWLVTIVVIGVIYGRLYYRKKRLIFPDLWNIKAGIWLGGEFFPAKVKRHWLYNLSHFNSTYVEIEINDLRIDLRTITWLRIYSRFYKEKIEGSKGYLFLREKYPIITDLSTSLKDEVDRKKWPCMLCIAYKKNPEEILRTETK